MHRGADAADALRDRPSVARIAAEQDQLDAAPHLAGRPRLRNLAIVNLDIHPQMAFDTGDGVDGDSFRHGTVSLNSGAYQRYSLTGQNGEFLDEDDLGQHLDGDHAQRDHDFRRRREVVPTRGLL